MRKLLVLLLAAAASGCATRAHRTTQAPPVVARNETVAPANPTAPNLTAASSTAANGTASTAAGQPAANQDLLKQGYKPVVRRGETLYCRKEMLTGSRFMTEVCLTQQQISVLEKQARDDLQLTPRPCADAACTR